MAMRLKVMSVRDRAANVFGQPFVVPNVGGAIRSFGDEINRADNANSLYLHPEDYDLFELGEFHDETADFDLLDKPRQVAVGKDLVRSKS